jgi:hypothetical protein
LLGDHLGTLLDLGERTLAAIEGKPRTQVLPRQQRAKKSFGEDATENLFESHAVVEISTPTNEKEAAR